MRRTLHRIQLAFSGEIIQATRSSVQWSSRIVPELDTQAFEGACDRRDFVEACRLYRGDFLSGFSLPDCPEFEEWAFFRRETLRGRFIQALERVIDEKYTGGEYLAAASFAARLVSLDPVREVSYRYLIRSHLLAGDRGSAERDYQELTRRLHDELGVAPEAQTRSLMQPAAVPPAESAPPTRYARGNGVHIAFQVFGTGKLDILVVPGFVSHVERI